MGSRVLLPEAGAEMGEDAAFDRFFPNQDRHSGKGLGNLIALPLQGERLKHGCTVFLDTFNELAPSPDQWEFLASIERVDEAKLDELLQEFDLSDKDISQTPREAAPPDDEILRRMAGGISEGNGRNEAAYTLLLRLAKKAVPRNEAIALATAWNQTNTPRYLWQNCYERLNQPTRERGRKTMLLLTPMYRTSSNMVVSIIAWGWQTYGNPTLRQPG